MKAWAVLGAAFAVPGIVCAPVAPAPVVVPTAPAAAAITPAPAVLAIAPVSDTVLRTGTEVQLKLAEPLTTQGEKLRVGYHFQMEVAEAVRVNDHVVIPAGTPAVGEITDVRNKGMWGKSGHLSASILYLSVNGRQIRMIGVFDDKGVTGTAGVVAAIAVAPVIGFFTTGTSARIPLGAQVKGFIGEDVPLVFTTPAPVTPLAVPAAAPPVASVATVSSAAPGVGAAASAPAIAAKTATAQ
jgi:hypothetical protein